jgi:hypothetical protein
MIWCKGYEIRGSATSSSLLVISQAYLTDDVRDVLLTDITVKTSTHLLHTLEGLGLNVGKQTGYYKVLHGFSQSRDSDLTSNYATAASLLLSFQFLFYNHAICFAVYIRY